MNTASLLSPLTAGVSQSVVEVGGDSVARLVPGADLELQLALASLPAALPRLEVAGSSRRSLP